MTCARQTMAKNDLIQSDLNKAYEAHNRQITEERHKAQEQASKMEVERKEAQRLNDERIRELQSVRLDWISLD